MQLGMIGLGRMGAGMSRRLMRGGHEVVAHDRDPAAVSALVADGATGAASPAELVAALAAPRAVWMMLPAGVVGAALDELLPLLEAGDVVVDGGNSHYVEDLRRARAAQQLGYRDDLRPDPIGVGVEHHDGRPRCRGDGRYDQ